MSGSHIGLHPALCSILWLYLLHDRYLTFCYPPLHTHTHTHTHTHAHTTHTQYTHTHAHTTHTRTHNTHTHAHNTHAHTHTHTHTLTVSKRESVFYYRATTLMAVRYHDYKAHFVTRDGWNLDPPEVGEGKEGRQEKVE